ncbi:hypothetical protein AM1_2168 [Acaryochloris marina MBIC11017]|uniref:Transposase DDE domain-containing protein n=1 Tax=Acaryochloris marina (strain MBIC 11017) TaxID=329726 RepID=B0BZX2_ACAM1|nr:hypothetical protein AM1_2168 [Acaryochloris marina MBIC11017]
MHHYSLPVLGRRLRKVLNTFKRLHAFTLQRLQRFTILLRT